MKTAGGIKIPIIGIAGWKKSGKTTLVTRLIAEFTARGLKVATVKHAHHDFQIDEGETDSARHRRAGAGQVAVVSSKRWAVINELAGAPEPTLSEVISWIGPCDLIIVEGYKSAPIPKIEVRRSGALSQVPLTEHPDVRAIAADYSIDDERLPVFALDDIAGIADFIAKSVGVPALGLTASTTPIE
jgi:molybdopterin-guanine dinucleotide biosynthesis adapter protein